MLQFLLLLCVAVTAVCGESVDVAPLKQQLLDVHNAYRRMQGAADMHALVRTYVYRNI